MPRQLYIVDRTQVWLYLDLIKKHAEDPNVEVLMDRRYGIVRTQPERDRRRNLQVAGELRERSYAVVTLAE
jgi:hypothetical protein